MVKRKVIETFDNGDPYIIEIENKCLRKRRYFYFNGKLQMTFPVNSRNEADGLGKQYWDNGQLAYYGFFKKDTWHGINGILRDHKGVLVYKGDFKNGKFHGNGETYDEKGKVLLKGFFDNNEFKG